MTPSRTTTLRTMGTAAVTALAVVGIGTATPAGARPVAAWAPTAPHRASNAHHRCRKAACRRKEQTRSVTASNGNLTVTFTSTEDGASVTFDIAATDTQAYGAVGPEVLAFGDGSSQGFGMPMYCLADPRSVTSDTGASHTYQSAGSYTATVTVGANCSDDQVTVSLPIVIGN